jgi:hypothetical protein
MWTMKMKVTTMGLLLIGVSAGAGRAQVVQFPPPTQYINSGLFTVARGEGVNVHVSLDDDRTAPSGSVSVQLFDQNGNMVARQDVTLRPGQSTTLQFRQPGLFRVHAETGKIPIPLCRRRALIGSAEIFKLQPSVTLPEDPTRPEEIRTESVSKILSITDDARGCDSAD